MCLKCAHEFKSTDQVNLFVDRFFFVWHTHELKRWVIEDMYSISAQTSHNSICCFYGIRTYCTVWGFFHVLINVNWFFSFHVSVKVSINDCLS